MPVFILGMPRCRTAWLSVCLSSLGWDVSHEGLRDHESFEDWADELDARLACAAGDGGCYSGAGDSNPSLVYWIDELLARWPGARFVVISREDDECLEAFVKAAPEDEAQIRMGWSNYLAAFKGAGDRLRRTSNIQRPTSNIQSAGAEADGPTVGDGDLDCGDLEGSAVEEAESAVAAGESEAFLECHCNGLGSFDRAACGCSVQDDTGGGLAGSRTDGTLDVGCSMLDVQRANGPRSRFWQFDDLTSDDVILDIAEFVTGRRPSALWARRMLRLRVTSIIESVERAVKPAKAKPIEVPSLESFDTTGLSAALYRNADFEATAAWWQQHQGQPLMQAALPPFGVVVSDEEGPAAALWAYECYGVPVAELAFPVTRPGLGLKRAAAALGYAVAACIAGIGKGHVPEASFRVFKTFAPRGLARYLKRLGFRDALTERVAMTLTL